jgi:hypothetical protein
MCRHEGGSLHGEELEARSSRRSPGPPAYTPDLQGVGVAGEQDRRAGRVPRFEREEHGAEPQRHGLHRLHPKRLVVRVLEVQRPHLTNANV